jgi:hypothetical protein
VTCRPALATLTGAVPAQLAQAAGLGNRPGTPVRPMRRAAVTASIVWVSVLSTV